MNKSNPRLILELHRIAWKRTLLLSAGLGLLVCVGNSKKIDSTPEAIAFFLGASGSTAVMLGCATAACAKTEKELAIQSK